MCADWFGRTNGVEGTGRFRNSSPLELDDDDDECRRRFFLSFFPLFRLSLFSRFRRDVALAGDTSDFTGYLAVASASLGCKALMLSSVKRSSVAFAIAAEEYSSFCCCDEAEKLKVGR